MFNDEIKVINFSQGIRSEEVYNNDLALQNQIERERLSIAGYGVNYGLNLSIINDFVLNVTNGTLVNMDGKEVFIANKNLDIDKPILIERVERAFPTEDGKVILNDIPYSITRLNPSEYDEKKNWNIVVRYEDNSSITANISSISDKTIYTDARNTKRPIIITYTTAYDRIDTIYIDGENQIKIKQGISSQSPTAYRPNDCKYLLGFIKVMHSASKDETDKLSAKTILIEEFNNRRTVYTDNNNNLYLCGTPFESLLKIYFEEPETKKDSMIWYDMDTNKLKVWRSTDTFVFTDILTFQSSNPNNARKFKTSTGYTKKQLSVYVQNINESTLDNIIWYKLSDDELIYYTDLEESKYDVEESFEFTIVPSLMKGQKIKYTINKYDGSFYWVAMNDTSYMPVLEYKMWCPNNDETKLLHYLPGIELDKLDEDRENHDLQYFLFKKSELHLRFTPFKNELDIMIDQIPLHRDQFNEITTRDIINSPELLNIAKTYYGYTLEELELLESNYLELGLGFKLKNKLDRPAFIEVNITHRINDSMLKNKFQRNAAFVKTETIIYNSSDYENNILVSTKVPFQYDEEQLEVFISGKRLKKEMVTEISIDNAKGEFCKSFSLDKNKLYLKDGDEITYKITTNVYSYDHVVSAIEEENKNLYEKLTLMENKIKYIEEEIENLKGV